MYSVSRWTAEEAGEYLEDRHLHYREIEREYLRSLETYDPVVLEQAMADFAATNWDFRLEIRLLTRYVAALHSEAWEEKALENAKNRQDFLNKTFEDFNRVKPDIQPHE